MANLFSPLHLRGVELKNRIAISPMCQYSATDGFANDWHLVHLGSRAVGGAGLVITEATAVSPEGRISPGDLGIWKDEHIPFLKRITDFIHQNGSVAGIQLAHAGHKASSHKPWDGGRYASPEEGGWQPVAASEHALLADDKKANALTAEGIHQVIDDFKAAAHRALAAGFRVIEIHAAHGYLLNGFLSPLVNQRTDEYGGSFENRIRLLRTIVKETRGILADDFPLIVRISASDWVEGGWTINDSVALAKVLHENGVDLIDCSSGGLAPPSAIKIGPNYQVPFAETIKNKVGIKTGAVGMITEASQADEIIVANKADLVLIARESLRNPMFPLSAAHELGHDVQWPIQYVRAQKKR
ncbi:oxidoreductase [Runella rosea]|uniref:Oxidoreductase n=1 Tax=Runella rosea TaxID=2259595 RepID=A0A344THX5_9BACT|nr:NADH:flavin oxidoreductase/NADH oxidase [Runella rosea]AXE18246.1 oxidoreductase [Runella rosea]